jgi:hypothetical protein
MDDNGDVVTVDVGVQEQQDLKELQDLKDLKELLQKERQYRHEVEEEKDFLLSDNGRLRKDIQELELELWRVQELKVGVAHKQTSHTHPSHTSHTHPSHTHIHTNPSMSVSVSVPAPVSASVSASASAISAVSAVSTASAVSVSAVTIVGDRESANAYNACVVDRVLRRIPEAHGGYVTRNMYHNNRHNYTD